jgi:hypothetical protein
VVAPGIETGISGSVATNFDHYTTEASEIVRCYKWQISNLKIEGWEEKIRGTEKYLFSIYLAT